MEPAKVKHVPVTAEQERELLALDYKVWNGLVAECKYGFSKKLTATIWEVP